MLLEISTPISQTILIGTYLVSSALVYSIHEKELGVGTLVYAAYLYNFKIKKNVFVLKQNLAK